MHTVPAAPPVPSPAAVARALAADPSAWRPLVEYRASGRWYGLVERTASHEVWLLSWLPGQTTDLHDHGPAVGAFVVAEGVLTERVVAPRPDSHPVEVTRRLTAGRTRASGRGTCTRSPAPAPRPR